MISDKPARLLHNYLQAILTRSLSYLKIAIRRIRKNLLTKAVIHPTMGFVKYRWGWWASQEVKQARYVF